MEFERLTVEEVELLKAYRAFTLAERNKVDEHIANLRRERMAEEAVRQLELDVAGRGPQSKGGPTL